jgi:glycosyltransferase involved in cell wall biosynthesis
MKLQLTLRGFLIVLLGGSCYFFGSLLSLISVFFHINSVAFKSFSYFLLLYSIVPVLAGVLLILIDLLILKKNTRTIQYWPVGENEKITVVLTAYNDELSIPEATKDFKNHPRVARVIVVSNNSTDKTLERAHESGAIVFNEPLQGYGACVYRALSEGSKYEDTSLTLLCEGDSTFKAYDIDKFLAYIPHADIVNGSRIVEQLRAKGTQLTNFMYFGNFFVGKLLEMKNINNGTLTDVGTTYKICRNEALKGLLPKISPTVNLEFNPYFLDMAMHHNYKVVECPITFHPRTGVSKGGNRNNFVAFKLGMRMIFGITISWSYFIQKKK